MPSHYESWGIAMAEALACGVPAVAYDLDAYRPVFGELVRYVPRFDLTAFRQEAAELVRETRAGRGCLEAGTLARFKRENSWAAAGERFMTGLRSLLEDE